MHRTIMLAATGLFLFTQAAAAKDHCTPIHYPPGATATSVHGVSTSSDSDAVTCYTFVAAAGQTAKLSVTKNFAMTVIDVGDDREEWSFKTQAKTYQVNVFLEGRSLGGDPFTMNVSIK